MNLLNKENIFFLLFSFLPVSIIIGSSISLTNLIILNLFFLIVLFKEKNFDFLNHLAVKLIFFLYLYLIFNSFISLNHEMSVARNIGFIRIIILFIFINYFFFYFENEKKLLNIWTIILSIFIIDIFIEYFFGTNIFGWGAATINGVPQPDGTRIVSFFKDEPIAGAFISAFIFLIFGHGLKNFNNRIWTLIFLSIAFTALVMTGERSNSFKIFLGIIIFFLFFDFFKIKTKIMIFLLFTFLFGLIISQSEYLKIRYVGQIYEKVNNKKNLKKFADENVYIELYKSGYSVFKNYPFFGVGNKNYRIETCKNKGDQLKFKYKCLTHPHQLYFEFLSEHGLVGTIIILSILFYLMYMILKSIILSRNYVQVGSFIFVLVNFTPFLPSGSFFSDFNITLFWINFSIMFACNKKTNIFAKNTI